MGSTTLNFLFLSFIVTFASADQKCRCTASNEFYGCGLACQTTCAAQGEACPIVNIQCNYGCYCMDGYARDKYGICVSINDCPS